MKKETAIAYKTLIILLVVIAILIGTSIYLISGRLKEQEIENRKTDTLLIQGKIKVLSETATAKKDTKLLKGTKISELLAQQEKKEEDKTELAVTVTAEAKTEITESVKEEAKKEAEIETGVKQKIENLIKENIIPVSKEEQGQTENQTEDQATQKEKTEEQKQEEKQKELEKYYYLDVEDLKELGIYNEDNKANNKRLEEGVIVNYETEDVIFIKK